MSRPRSISISTASRDPDPQKSGVTTRALFVLLAAAVAMTLPALAATPLLPPKPSDYVLDEFGVFPPAREEALARKLENFERETSNQIVVAVMPRVPDGFALEDFTQRTAEEWGAGQKERDNGIVLFVFPEAREMRIEVGYGLEGAVPDALANGIIQAEIVPSFRAGDMAGGIERGVDALIGATKGEYKGTGRTAAPEQAIPLPMVWFLVLIFVLIAIHRASNRGGTSYGSGGRRGVWFPSSGGGGGGFSGGGGGFSGGGGSFGGGGASGRW